MMNLGTVPKFTKIHHIEVANIPIINPNILPTAVILPLYNLFDSGINSP